MAKRDTRCSICPNTSIVWTAKMQSVRHRPHCHLGRGSIERGKPKEAGQSAHVFCCSPVLFIGMVIKD